MTKSSRSRKRTSNGSSTNVNSMRGVGGTGIVNKRRRSCCSCCSSCRSSNNTSGYFGDNETPVSNRFL